MYKRDQIKEKYLKDKGITILRFNDGEVLKNINETLESIWSVCESIINKENR